MAKENPKAETKEEVKEEGKKTCFVASPIGSGSSEIRRAADGLIDSVLKPVLEELNYEVIAPHRIDGPGSITNQIIEYLLNCDLVIANLTRTNPNVMYELAVRHGIGKPVISIAEEGTILPFDIAAERTIPYSNDMAGVQELKKALKAAILGITDAKTIDNPIYRVLEKQSLYESIKGKTPDDSFQLFVVDRLQELTDQISKITPSKTYNKLSRLDLAIMAGKVSEVNNVSVSALYTLTIKVVPTGDLSFSILEYQTVINDYRIKIEKITPMNNYTIYKISYPERYDGENFINFLVALGYEVQILNED
ncbi:hypothetical protein [Larkinella arboricola]